MAGCCAPQLLIERGGIEDAAGKGLLDPNLIYQHPLDYMALLEEHTLSFFYMGVSGLAVPPALI